MATLTIPDATYRDLVERAARRRVSLEELVVPLLEQEPEEPAQSPSPMAEALPPTGEAWRQAHEQLMRDAEEWTKHLPPDHELDLDYYREREDAQS